MRFSQLLMIAILLAASVQASSVRPPSAPEHPVIDDYFGTRVADPYRWMENSQDPALRKWVEAENRLTESWLAKIPLRRLMASRLKAIWNYPDQSTPEQVLGPRLFFERNTGLQNQSIQYVRDSASAGPRVLVDPNVISPDGSLAFAQGAPSPDGKLLAYALSPAGGDWMTVHVRDVATGKDLTDVLDWLKFSYVAWTNDDRGFFYERYPAPPKGKEISQQDVRQSLYYHRLGTPQSVDRLIYARSDRPDWYITADISEDGRTLFVVLNRGTAPENELYVADLGDPLKPNVAAPLKALYVKNNAMYSPIDVRNGELYLETDLGAPRRRIVAAKLDGPEPARWRTVVPEGKGVIESVGFAGGYLAVDTMTDAVSRFELYDTDGRLARRIALPEPGTVLGFSGLQGSDVLYYGFGSFLWPTSSYRYDLRTGKTETVFQPEMKFDPAKFETREVFYPSKDGTMVPMFILAAKSVKLDGSHPAILLGYGGFGDTYRPFFKRIYAAWLESGGIYAIANIGGGDTYGDAWHRAGMLGRKQNTFDDFAWAAKYLIEKGYTSAKHLGIQGKSNGGLLIGASITQNPALFGAAHIDRGVLDMLRYQRFSSGPGVVPEYGSSDDPRAFKWLYAYSPLQNVRQGTCYPPTLITTSWDDDRVVPMHSFKFAATLQRAQACANPVLLMTMEATAHSYMPTDKAIAQTADVLAFEGYNLGMTSASNSQTQ